ncbi:UNVERIFIED_CONTAM: putative late blight resistance proteinR1A-4 [Sesamum radiatum]|uniref:Late blight resistance proteinR1A-4 n=1 Tax=Sesamum radiatum TaxID=300843 RepID=A0AAW2UNA7_SESRA
MISGLQDMFLSALYPCKIFDYTHQDFDLDFKGCFDNVIDEFDSILEALSKIKDGEKKKKLQERGIPRLLVHLHLLPVSRASRWDLIKTWCALRTGSLSKLDIISIVGMGGIGKTTLARNLYREPNGELNHKSIEELAERLYKNLKGRRYLVVMDDVWDTKVWDDVKRFFPDDNNGLPLAIVVIGGLVSKDSTAQKDWECIAEDERTAATNGDYEIFVTQLIKLWIAEGFVKPPTPKSFEQVAEDYLKDLVDRCLIQVQRRTYTGEIKTCTIHDMLRELCMKKAQDEKLYRIMNRHSCVFPQGRSDQCRFSIHGGTFGHRTNDCDSYVLSRSLLYFCNGPGHSLLVSFTTSWRLLRVLDALTIRFYDFPVEVMELVHLRYLVLTCSGEDKLPASIYKLGNLQTLIVYRGDIPYPLWFARYIFHITLNICKMPQLRNPMLERGFLPYPFLEPVVKDSVVLENLQTLTGVTDLRCTKEVCAIIPNLKKLGVSYISYIKDSQDKWSSYEFDNFVYLHQLETLKCRFITKDPLATKFLTVNLAFPSNLKKLTLSGCRIPWEKMMVVGTLPNLQVLKLRDHAFEGSTWEPNEGEFSKLKFLRIDVSNGALES